MSIRDVQAEIASFMQLIGQATPDLPGVPDEKTVRLRMELVDEECQELLDALRRDDLAGIADGCADAVVVIVGTAAAYGVDLAPVLEAVCLANRTKAGGPRSESGKALKGVDFKHPDIAAILGRQEPIAAGPRAGKEVMQG